MATIVKLELLIDNPNSDDTCETVNQLVQQASALGNDKIVDWTITDNFNVSAEIEDIITNDAYVKGDAFSDWVVYSRSEAAYSDDQAGYWSNEYGWTTFDLATRFDAKRRNLPVSRGGDATLMLLNSLH